MSDDKCENLPKGSRPQDLIDFHLRWSEFRDDAVSVTSDGRLSLEARETIRWLIIMADRIGVRDLD